MPQKDTALVLARAARSFICSRNAVLSAGGDPLLFPRFPLYAFADELPEGGYSSCLIDAPVQEGGEFSFPVQLACGTGGQAKTFNLKIVFAQAEGPGVCGAEDAPQDQTGGTVFPLRPRVFRTGRIEFSGDSWEVWDERWQKIS